MRRSGGKPPKLHGRFTRTNTVKVPLPRYNRPVARFHLRCSECGLEIEERPLLYVCHTCSEQQEPGGVTRGVLEVVIEELPEAWPDAVPRSAVFLTAFLPVDDPRHLPPLPVGGTPLMEASGLRRELAMPWLWLKDDSRNPSGSTKDRASQLVVALVTPRQGVLLDGRELPALPGSVARRLREDASGRVAPTLARFVAEERRECGMALRGFVIRDIEIVLASEPVREGKRP